jgi:hypothetical protein
MGLSTKDLVNENGGGGMAKTIAPGNHTLRINSIVLEDFQFIDGAKHLILNVETEPIDGFEGFLIDKDDESKGKYKGQIGRVKASQYAFADGQTKSGIKIQRDRSLMMFLANLSKATGIMSWFEEQDNKFNTIEDFVRNFSNNAPLKDKYLDFCIAGKEYENKSGYTAYDMWLPKAENNKYAYGNEGSDRILKYDEAKYLKKLEVKPVDNFGDDDDDFPTPGKTSSDFSLD